MTQVVFTYPLMVGCQTSWGRQWAVR